MLKNYFKTAWRNLTHNKVYSTLNIFGLAVGMAVALLIGLWSYHESSYDKFLPNNDRLYRVVRNFNSNGQILTFNTVSLKLVNTLRNEIPEIEYVMECDWINTHGLIAGDKNVSLRGAQIGGDFLKAFKYPLVSGNAATVLQDPYSIVLTQSAAKTLFGDENPIGKTVRYDNKDNLKVTGILKDLPTNSTLRFQYVIPFSYFETSNDWVRDARKGNYGWNSFQLFVSLKPGTDAQKLSAKLKDIEKVEKKNPNAMLSDVILHPLAKWHLYEFKDGYADSGFIEYVRMFTIIGILVLLIACINFINLTTARSEKRAREVGVRKVVGSMRKDLIFQFLVESFLITFFSFVLAMALVQVSLAAFNEMTGKKIAIPYDNVVFWCMVMSGLLVTALLAGSRPAFYLSSFRPIKVLKGKLQSGRTATLPRKVLVVVQFSCSVALIISTVIIYRQIQHGKDRPAGFDLNQLMYTDANGTIWKNYTGLKNDLLASGVADQVSWSSSPTNEIYWHTDVDSWSGKRADETIEMGVIATGEDYFKTMGMTMKEGRAFTGQSDTLNAIFNEEAIKRMRLKEPINQVIRFEGTDLRIVGVVKDALMLSPFAPADPTLFLFGKYKRGNLLYRLSNKFKTQDAITKLTAIFNKHNPAFAYTYDFSDISYAAKFNMEVLIGKLAGIFSVLAIFISCLGLFGLAAFVAEQRTKEIGIRKVLGATVSQLWLMLSKDFIVLVVISCLIASPIALYFLQGWLEKYNYRITIGPGIFIVAGAMALCITLLTVSMQAVRAALANPVKSLRSE